MSKFSSRHPGPELMDKGNIPSKDLFRNYHELHIINRWLGGYRITVKGLGKLIHEKEKTYSILDAGCGGGDTLSAIMNWGKRKGFHFDLTGIDLSEAAITYAKQNHGNDGINWVQENVFTHLNSGVTYDIIVSSLFMHHLPDEKIAELLQLMNRSARVGIIVNDLQRHPLAYHSIRLLTQLFSRSYLVKHDAPLSVQRGFHRSEWENIASRSPIKLTECRWQWAFRYLIIIKK